MCIRQTAIHSEKKKVNMSTILQAQFNGMGALACLPAIPLCWAVCWLGQLSCHGSHPSCSRFFFDSNESGKRFFAFVGGRKWNQQF